ncbi:protein of unknown function [Zobellia uliginosa]|uniref:Acyl-coenzyme A thioesterase PaaI, contains HGG motif n=1 Tax=Zobellia uliginosa TaxID=143224 RepID=A0ABY1L501_9FLAO|nr:DUF4442 domain-containing protein [Zobellia uliginosa]SIT07833.1 protein of unknown function [Zobellia uliginosa]
MSFYSDLVDVGSRFIGKHKLLKYGFNLSPMYRRSTARVKAVSADLRKVTVKLPIGYKNRNYVNSIFGGSMFSAVDPIPMVQLINILGDDYVVWDKSAEIYFKRPAKEDLYADFEYSWEEIEKIKQRVSQEDAIDIVKTTYLMNKARNTVFCEVKKTIYIADKAFYKKKRALAEAKKKEVN